MPPYYFVHMCEVQQLPEQTIGALPGNVPIRVLSCVVFVAELIAFAAVRPNPLFPVTRVI